MNFLTSRTSYEEVRNSDLVQTERKAYTRADNLNDLRPQTENLLMKNNKDAVLPTVKKSRNGYEKRASLQSLLGQPKRAGLVSRENAHNTAIKHKEQTKCSEKSDPLKRSSISMPKIVVADVFRQANSEKGNIGQVLYSNFAKKFGEHQQIAELLKANRPSVYD